MPQAPNPSHVVANELIESAWGNAVVDIIGDVASLPPASGVGSVANRLFDAAGAGTALANRVAALEHQHGEIAVVGTVVTATTDASGYTPAVTTPQFAGPALPSVQLTLAMNAPYLLASRFDWNNLGLFQVFVMNSTTGAPVANTPVSFYWVAVGTLA
jgi:hypothetical protein